MLRASVVPSSDCRQFQCARHQRLRTADAWVTRRWRCASASPASRADPYKATESCVRIVSWSSARSSARIDRRPRPGSLELRTKASNGRHSRISSSELSLSAAQLLIVPTPRRPPGDSSSMLSSPSQACRWCGEVSSSQTVMGGAGTASSARASAAARGGVQGGAASRPRLVRSNKCTWTSPRCSKRSTAGVAPNPAASSPRSRAQAAVNSRYRTTPAATGAEALSNRCTTIASVPPGDAPRCRYGQRT